MGVTDHYKCFCSFCGGIMEFNAKLQKLKCPFCDTEMALEKYRTMADQTIASMLISRAMPRNLKLLKLR